MRANRHFQRARLWAITLALIASAHTVDAQDKSNDPQSCANDAMIVFDASGSMSTTDRSLKVPRIDGAKRAMNRVIPDVAHLRRLGLIVYGEGEYNDCNTIELRLKPMPEAAATLLGEVANIDPRGRTPLTESVKQAADVLDFRNRPGTIVLLTDGEETCGGDPCKLAAQLKKQAKDLTIHVIGYRHETEGYFTSRCMADVTGGQYLRATNEAELVEALRKTLGCPFVTDNTRQRQTPIKLAHSDLRLRFCQAQ